MTESKLGKKNASDNYVKLERVVKGFAHHHRLRILDLLYRTPELSVDEISQQLQIGYMNASDHVRKMTIAGLVWKKNRGMSVSHILTPRAESILVFCKKLK